MKPWLNPLYQCSVAVDGPVTIPQIDHAPWPLDQGDVPLARFGEAKL